MVLIISWAGVSRLHLYGVIAVGVYSYSRPESMEV
jgi:hypothetical protein